jgi:hypothetical protein
MIRYPWKEAEIENLVDANVPNWRRNAARRTRRLIVKGFYEEKTTIWSDIKSIYTEKQHNKCIYCEQQLEPNSSIAWDLEHFRPKGRINKWIPSETLAELEENAKSGLDYDKVSLGEEHDTGYYRLAYHLWNYAVSCKKCNSSFKGDFFPIATDRILDKDHPREYTSEQAYLVYPFGEIKDDYASDDPEDLIVFYLHMARPRYSLEEDSRKYRRACVIIDFLGLNREGLRIERAKYLYFTAVRNLSDTNRVSLICSEEAQFTSCVRCFVKDCKEYPEFITIAEQALEEELKRLKIIPSERTAG